MAAHLASFSVIREVVSYLTRWSRPTWGGDLAAAGHLALCRGEVGVPQARWAKKGKKEIGRVGKGRSGWR